MRYLLPIVAMLLTITHLASCKDAVTGVTNHPTDPETVPTMVTNDVQTIISDSGHTRYRITAPVWSMYENAKQPHWIFPKGVSAEELDNNYNTVSTIKCDSAYYDKLQMLWHLTGRVKITNTNGDIILTDELYWDQGKHQLYSEAFIHIEKQQRVIEGYGYQSNERLTTYELRQVEAIFPIDETHMPHPNSGNTPRPAVQMPSNTEPQPSASSAHPTPRQGHGTPPSKQQFIKQS